MLKWDEMHPIGDIIEDQGLPVFIRRQTFNIDFAVLITHVEHGKAYGEGYKMAEPTGHEYSYALSQVAFMCDLADLLEARDFILQLMKPNLPYHLPSRAKGQYHSIHSEKLPQYIPGETVLKVKRNGEWVNAVFTGFEEKNGITRVYTYYDGTEKFCRLDGGNIDGSVPQQKWTDQTKRDIEEVKGWSTSLSEIVHYLTDVRGVRYLIHFTPADNLVSIIENGIVSRTYFDDSDDFVVTDKTRIDNHLECSCFSLSFPNYQMFYKKRNDCENDFAVLAVDIQALCDSIVDHVYFLPVNAAYKELRHNITDYTQLQDARNMFADELFYMGKGYQRFDMMIPDQYTTCPQAEIMVDSIIPPKYIREIHFENKQVCFRWATKIDHIPEGATVYYGDKYFARRRDYKAWQQKGIE